MRLPSLPFSTFSSTVRRFIQLLLLVVVLITSMLMPSRIAQAEPGPGGGDGTTGSTSAPVLLSE